MIVWIMTLYIHQPDVTHDRLMCHISIVLKFQVIANMYWTSIALIIFVVIARIKANTNRYSCNTIIVELYAKIWSIDIIYMYIISMHLFRGMKRLMAFVVSMSAIMLVQPALVNAITDIDDKCIKLAYKIGYNIRDLWK